MPATLTATDAKRLLDACFVSHLAVGLMPTLPADLTRRHLQVIDALHALGSTPEGKPSRVSEIASALGITRPGVTKAVSELEVRGDVRRNPDPTDGRVVLVSLTEQGAHDHQRYLESYFSEVGALLSQRGVTQDDIEAFARLAQTTQDVLVEARGQVRLDGD